MMYNQSWACFFLGGGQLPPSESVFKESIIRICEIHITNVFNMDNLIMISNRECWRSRPKFGF
jgi:hypothetical protein